MGLRPYVSLHWSALRIWRFMYWPPWATSNWGFLGGQMFRPQRGGDEYHNDSWFIVVPLLGVFTIFTGKFSYDGGPHVYYHGPEGFEGVIHPDCDHCQEFVNDVDQT